MLVVQCRVTCCLYDETVFVQASILHSVHYQLFRNKGQAFELRECEYAEPNYTLATEIAGRSVLQYLYRF